MKFTNVTSSALFAWAVALLLLAGLVGCDRSSLGSNEAIANEAKAESDKESDEDLFTDRGSVDELVTEEKKEPKMSLSEEEWKEKLSAEEYRILREAGTERAHTGELLEVDKEGTYVCGGCGEPLFSSETKFESGTGWPSFYDALDEGTVGLAVDDSMGTERIEVYCTNCGGHLGHVFKDGPEPSGLRYCMNSAAMDFEADDESGADESEEGEDED